MSTYMSSFRRRNMRGVLQLPSQAQTRTRTLAAMTKRSAQARSKLGGCTRSFIAALSLVPLLAAACLGSESELVENAEIQECVDTPTVLPTAAWPPEGGLTANAMVELTGQQHQLVLLHQAAADEHLLVAPSSHGQPVQLTLAHLGGEMRHVSSTAPGCEGESCPEFAVYCPDSIELDVQVSLQSLDGAFNEHWPATLKVNDLADPESQIQGGATTIPGQLSVSYEFALDATVGSISLIALHVPDSAGEPDARYWLEAVFHDGALVKAQIRYLLSWQESGRVVAREGVLYQLAATMPSSL